MTAAVPPVAVITGAGSGIGGDIAVAMLTAGHRVALAGRNEATLQATAGRAGSGEALVAATDVRSAGSVEALFAAVVARWGRVDVLINNAGTFGTGAPLDSMPLEQWNAVIDTNLTGSFLCAQAAFRQMKGQDPQGGRIINNGSVSAHVPRPFAVAYTASKHAITGLTKAISLEGRPYQIACGQIDIGNAATEMTGAFGTGVPQADGSIRAEPLMDTGHVTEAVLLMAALPLDANVEFMTIMATNMPYIGRGLTGPQARERDPIAGRPAPYTWRRPLRAPARSSRLHRPVMAAPAGHTRGTTLTRPPRPTRGERSRIYRNVVLSPSGGSAGFDLGAAGPRPHRARLAGHLAAGCPDDPALAGPVRPPGPPLPPRRPGAGRPSAPGSGSAR